ncbi:MAG: hypothetical protein HYR91_01075 [Flavobacteriia bacterium]|nr:hypothetical protein [Flavobacteriia bacterium]
MKKTILFVTMLTSGFAYSQEVNNQINKLSIDFNIGFNKPVSHFTTGYGTSVLSPFHTDIGLRYMLNSRIGLKFDAGFDNFKNSSSTLAFNSKLLRFSLQSVFNLGNILNFNSFTSKFGLLAHAGAGISSLKDAKFGIGKGADDMIHTIFGITPQYKVSSNLCVNLDFTFIGNIYQDHTFDYKSTISDRGFDGNFYNLSLGFSYYLGKGEKHQDWVDFTDNKAEQIAALETRLVNATANLQKTTATTPLNPTVTPIEKPTLNALEQQLNATENALKDSDNDGVADYLDLEPNTPAGVKVDKDGRTAKS